MARDEFSGYMVAEFEKLSDLLQSNEADGEKRAAFFVTLAGAVGGALAFVVGKESAAGSAYLALVVPAIAVLLMLGYLTFVRVVSRNVATDRLKRSLSRIRRYFLDGPDDPRLKFIPFDPYKVEPRSLWAPAKLGKGGWVETLGLVNALLVGGLVAVAVKAGVCACAAIGGGVLAAGGAWCLLMYDAAERYRREMWKGADSFILERRVLERKAIETSRKSLQCAERLMRAGGARVSVEERKWDGQPLAKDTAQVIFVIKGKFTFSGGRYDEVVQAGPGDLVYFPKEMELQAVAEKDTSYLLGIWKRPG